MMGNMVMLALLRKIITTPIHQCLQKKQDQKFQPEPFKTTCHLTLTSCAQIQKRNACKAV